MHRAWNQLLTKPAIPETLRASFDACGAGLAVLNSAAANVLVGVDVDTTLWSREIKLTKLASENSLMLADKTHVLCLASDCTGSVLIYSKRLEPTQLQAIATLGARVLEDEGKASESRSELDSLSNQLADIYEELNFIYQLSSGMRVNRSQDDFFLQTCLELIEVMQVRMAGVMLLDGQGVAQTPNLFGEVSIQPHLTQRLGADLQKRFEREGSSLLINQIGLTRQFDYLAPFARRLLAVPMQRQDKTLGALICLDNRGDDFNSQDIKLLTSISNEMAVFIENANLFADARGLMMGLMHALTSAVDAKDAYTCGHSQRVALFGREIARRANFSEALCERVYMAGLLHDVGKIGVSEAVLQKAGKLTDEEFEEIKKHVEIGAKILKDVKQVEDLIPGVRHHHERYDGRGYPDKLAGQDIPLFGRILCVADCFDAMTSNRTYRRALPIEVAMMEIRRCSGTQFDPTLADAFLTIGVDTLRSLISSVGEGNRTLVRAA